MELTEGVFRLGSPYVNFYAIEEGGRLTIVDGGASGYWDEIPRLLAATKLAITDIAAVVLTHSHGDHTGCVERLQAESGADVFIHTAEEAVLTGREKQAAPSGAAGALLSLQGLKMIAHMLTNGGMKSTTLSTVETYTEDEVLDVPGKPRVVYTPGHSKGHSALFVEQRDALFTGDALVTRDLRGRTGPRMMDINVDHAGARRALDRFEGIEAALLLPGHGEPWRDGVAAAVERARRN
ncbi:MAG TPA: MBL fold metallo-hydrolase [Actinomycetota bacterium]|nr:MBL fold metallo-hydrolase [Actinomycetota bacterium]